ncbi:hypothetical protein [Pseudomonas japonica]|uniref:hypothetical protein n=1 Tax=Pseudomonas japonica TaxID=256466 RepID=UPI001C61598C|nr:hypothetical protein [Pseudomonas japonica]
MKLKHTLRLTVLAAVAGSLMAPVAQAQSLAVASQAEKVPAYYVADFDLKDPEAIKPYREQVDADVQALQWPLCRASGPTEPA